jgi:hypothetical protein
MTESFSSIGREPVFVNKVDVEQIDEQPQPLPQYKDKVLLMNSIDQNDQPAAQAEIPEYFRHHALLGAFAGDPLQDKAHHEHALPEEANKGPQGQMGVQPNENILHFSVPLFVYRLSRGLIQASSLDKRAVAVHFVIK